MVGPATFVVPLQNGVEAASQPPFSAQNTWSGVSCGTFSWVVAPGKSRSISAATFIKFGELDNRRSERVELLRQAFGKTSVKADIPSDIHKALWKKFLLVTAFGGVGAVSRAPIGIIRTMPETRALLQQCMEEVAAVARVSRIQLSDSVVSDRMSYVDTLPANSTTSLQRDIAEGKPSELDYAGCAKKPKWCSTFCAAGPPQRIGRNPKRTNGQMRGAGHRLPNGQTAFFGHCADGLSASTIARLLTRDEARRIAANIRQAAGAAAKAALKHMKSDPAVMQF